MARRGPLKGRDQRADPPELVQITIVPGPPDRSLRRRVIDRRRGTHRRALALLAGAAVALGAILVAVLAAGAGVAPERVLGKELHNPGAPGIAAAYEYPLRCLNVTLAATDPAYARVALDRASPCWRYGGYATVVFHRVDGVWRQVIDSGRYSCPVGSLPAVVQTELALCPRGR